jgi:hypothetical protein
VDTTVSPGALNGIILFARAGANTRDETLFTANATDRRTSANAPWRQLLPSDLAGWQTGHVFDRDA